MSPYNSHYHLHNNHKSFWFLSSVSLGPVWNEKYLASDDLDTPAVYKDINNSSSHRNPIKISGAAQIQLALQWGRRRGGSSKGRADCYWLWAELWTHNIVQNSTIEDVYLHLSTISKLCLNA